MTRIARTLKAAAAALCLCPLSALAQSAAGEEEFLKDAAAKSAIILKQASNASEAIKKGRAGGSAKAAPKSAPCQETGELDFRHFEFRFKEKRGSESKSSFTYRDCVRYSGAGGKALFTVRRYESDDYDLLIVTLPGAGSSELALTARSGDVAAKLGALAHKKLLSGEAVDLGTITLGDAKNPKKFRTGAATIKTLRLQGEPTNHYCQPWPMCSGA